MDNKTDCVIFQLKFLRRILSAPTTDNVIDLSYMSNDQNEFDPEVFQQQMEHVTSFGDLKRDTVITWCHDQVKDKIKESPADAFRVISQEQVRVLFDMMRFLLVQYGSSDDISPPSRSKYVDMVMLLCVVLLQSNRRAECTWWIREYMSALTSIRMNHTGESILHRALNVDVGTFPREPIMRLLVEEGKMDVNLQDNNKQTPLHLVSFSVEFRVFSRKSPTDEMKQLAELLINAGAHMDLKDSYGNEASNHLHAIRPQYRFNVNLQCLAAKAILKSGVRYQEILPPDMIPLVDDHIVADPPP